MESNFTKERIESIDLLRGLVMVLMALDHTRDFVSNAHFDPVDLSVTTPLYFFTRWITHICAPVFVFLAGTSAFLLGTKVSKNELAKFLLLRGIWLIVLEFTIVRFGWQFNFDYSYLWIQVIWVIGISMIILSVLIYLPLKIIAAFGLSMVLFHNLFDNINSEQFGSFKILWLILHEEGAINWGTDRVFWVVYPVIPWVGVMASGYVFGKLFTINFDKRKKILLIIGVILTIIFIILRYLNFYGDPSPRIQHESFLFSFMSFLNCTKYPPSLLFLLMTIGPSIILLSVLENVKTDAKKYFLVFGKTPLFFYLIHVPVIHLFAVLIAAASGLNITFLFDNSYPETWPAEFGYGLIGVYIIWIIVVVLLYPINKWFMKLKHEKKNRWLSYF